MNNCFGAGKKLLEHQKSWVRWYDFGFRMYDPAIARFQTMDPIVAGNTHQSPYVYADNSPVVKIDYMGLDGMEGADGLTNEQWIEASRPGASTTLASSYRKHNQNLKIETDRMYNIINSALNGDVDDLINSGLKGFYTTDKDKQNIYRLYIYGFEDVAANGGGASFGGYATVMGLMAWTQYRNVVPKSPTRWVGATEKTEFVNWSSTNVLGTTEMKTFSATTQNSGILNTELTGGTAFSAGTTYQLNLGVLTLGTDLSNIMLSVNAGNLGADFSLGYDGFGLGHSSVTNGIVTGSIINYRPSSVFFMLVGIHSASSFTRVTFAP